MDKYDHNDDGKLTGYEYLTKFWGWAPQALCDSLEA
jgi:hypothetical protein